MMVNIYVLKGLYYSDDGDRLVLWIKKQHFKECGSIYFGA
jgi:hypothetical protein